MSRHISSVFALVRPLSLQIAADSTQQFSFRQISTTLVTLHTNACKDGLSAPFVRQAVASEQLSSAFFEAQASRSGNRPDLSHFHSTASQLLRDAEKLQEQQRTRPSARQLPIRAAGLSLGLLSRVMPRHVSLVISGAIQDAIVDSYTDALRKMQESKEAGSGGDANAEESIRKLQDQERAPEGSPTAPDLLALSQMKNVSELGLEGLLGALVKFTALAAIDASKKIEHISVTAWLEEVRFACIPS